MSVTVQSLSSALVSVWNIDAIQSDEAINNTGKGVSSDAFVSEYAVSPLLIIAAGDPGGASRI